MSHPFTNEEKNTENFKYKTQTGFVPQYLIRRLKRL